MLPRAFAAMLGLTCAAAHAGWDAAGNAAAASPDRPRLAAARRLDLDAPRRLDDDRPASPLSTRSLATLSERSWIEHDCRGADRVPMPDDEPVRWVSPAAGDPVRISAEIGCYLRDAAVLAGQWVPLRTEREDAGRAGMRVWYDQPSLQRRGRIATLRTRYDRIDALGLPARPVARDEAASRIVFNEFDCAARTYRERYALDYSEPRLQGRVLRIASGTTARWQTIPRREPIARDFEFACRSK